MSMSARFKPYRPLRRKVAIRRDGEDFVIAFQPEDIVVFRHAEATALRRACVVLRWEVVSETVAEASNPPLGDGRHRSNSPMINKAGHIAWAAEAVVAFQKHCGTGD